MGEYSGFPPDSHQVNGEQHGMQSRHRRMLAFEAMNAGMLFAVILVLLILLGVFIAVYLGVRIDAVVGGMWQ